MKVKVEMVVNVPVAATEEQIHDWISYNVHERADLTFDNPLCDYDIETEWNSLEVTL